MEWMDRNRRIAGWIWVGLGLLVHGIAVASGHSPGPITWVLVLAVAALALAAASHASGRITVLLGWVTSILLSLDLIGAVADRFGAFGAPGGAGVSWGSWEAFADYTATLLHLSNGPVVTLAAIGATVLEVALAGLLLSGWQRRWVGKATAGLFTLYLVTMALSAEREGVVSFAMPVLIGGALLLSATPPRVANLASEVLTSRDRGDQAGREEPTSGGEVVLMRENSSPSGPLTVAIRPASKS